MLLSFATASRLCCLGDARSCCQPLCDVPPCCWLVGASLGQFGKLCSILCFRMWQLKISGRADSFGGLPTSGMTCWKTCGRQRGSSKSNSISWTCSRSHHSTTVYTCYSVTFMTSSSSYSTDNELASSYCCSFAARTLLTKFARIVCDNVYHSALCFSCFECHDCKSFATCFLRCRAAETP